MVDALLRVRVSRFAELNRAIDERDDMLDYAVAQLGHDRDRALASYFVNALEQYRLLQHVAAWRFPAGPKRMLDFASGYGRLTRLLVHEQFAGELHVSDILEGAMEFQASQFGVKTILSTAKPEDLPIGDSYDLIFVASLFTHLPPESFTRWLHRLASLLTPDGLLVFSVHDETIAPGKVEGISFRQESESRILDHAEYGSTWVTEQFVRDQVASIGRDYACVRIPRGLADWQDIYVVSPTALDAASPRRVPKGFVDNVRIDGSGVRVSGWASSVHEDAARVEARLDDTIVASTTTFADRPDVAAWLGVPSAVRCGFECVIPHEAIRSYRYQVLTLSAFSQSGEERVLYIGTIDGVHGHVNGERVKDLERQAEQAKAEAAAMRQQVEEMRRSPLWRAIDRVSSRRKR